REPAIRPAAPAPTPPPAATTGTRRGTPAPRRGPAGSAARPPWPGRAPKGALRASPERVEGAGFDQALHHTSIDEAEVDTPAEVGQAREGSRLARLDDRVDGGGAHVLDGGEAEVNGLAEHGEARARDAHGGRLHPEPHAAAP